MTRDDLTSVEDPILRMCIEAHREVRAFAQGSRDRINTWEPQPCPPPEIFS